jgi:ribosomal protein S18 acetylase RimI-like enzyme
MSNNSEHAADRTTFVETVIVRQMTHRDVASVARIHTLAFPGFFLTSLGGSFLRYYYRMFPTYGGTIALVAETAAGDIAGFVVGSANPRGFYRRLLRRHWFGFTQRGILALARRPFAAPRLLRGLTHPGSNPGGPTVVGLFSIAVAPNAQGGRAGGALMETFLARAAERGAESVFLHTDADGNERANAYYRRHGFIERQVIETPEGRRLNEYWHTLAPTSTCNEDPR